MNSFRALILLIVALLPALGSAGEIVSGPMLGYRAHREVMLWVETKAADSVRLEYWLKDEPTEVHQLEHLDTPHHPGGGQIHHFRPGLLKMGATYDYRLVIDGKEQELAAPATFETQDLWEWRKPPPDFEFLVGSCSYINDSEFDRPGDGYGKTTRTYELMGETGADFMIWTGDNWYWREPDYSSISGLWYRPSHDRAIPEMQKLLGSMHHYATWDDHDYGPNDSNWSFEYKAEALDIFKAYWGNHTYGESDNPGVYSKFFWGDAAFFLMDNHYYRDAAELDQDKHAQKTQWGRQQLEWLKQSLLAAKKLKHFRFKFIASGNQMLQTAPFGEPHELYRREREELMDFIIENEITGVVFLTGDVHHSAMYRRQIGDAGQWVYEVTSSPLSSGAFTDAAKVKGDDPHVIPNTIIGDQNFVKISLTGKGRKRALRVVCIDKKGETRFDELIRAVDLRPAVAE